MQRVSPEALAINYEATRSHKLEFHNSCLPHNLTSVGFTSLSLGSSGIKRNVSPAIYRRLGKPCCFHVQDKDVGNVFNRIIGTCPPTKLHRLTFQKIAI